MRRIHKVGFAAALIVTALAAVWLLTDRASQAAETEVLAAVPGKLGWYRGNLHAHTLWSDGDHYPEMVADDYRQRGYQFLALTDHNILQAGERWVDEERNIGGAVALSKLEARFPSGWIQRRGVEGRTEVRLRRLDEIAAKLNVPDEFLVLSGEEISDSASSAQIHLNAINIAEYLPPARGNSVVEVLQRNVDALAQQSSRLRRPMLILINHPNFLESLTAEDLMRVRGDGVLFELYNGHPLSFNPGRGDRPSAERMWDIALTYRIAALGLPLIYGTANDDSHQYHGAPSGRAEPGRGWNMVLSPDLSAPSLVSALRQGRFYASTGVQLKRVASSNKTLRVEVEQQDGVEYLIEFLGTRRGFDSTSEPMISRDGREVYGTRRYSDEIGAMLSSKQGSWAEYRFDKDDLYVRARVTSSRRHPSPSQPGQYEQAWIQPVLGPAGRDYPSGELLTAPAAPPLRLHARQVAPEFIALPRDSANRLMASKTDDCSLDILQDVAGASATAFPRTGEAMFGGWFADRNEPHVPRSLSIVLRGSADLAIEVGNGRLRPDVAAAFGKPAWDGAGFHQPVKLAGVPPGAYAVLLVGHYPGRDVGCSTGQRIVVR